MSSDRTAVRDRLNRIFQEVFEDDSIEIRDGTTADDIDLWDSVMHITLVLAVEREFAIRLSAAEVGTLDNVGQMIDLIAARAGK